jgi:hypothetical protein
MESHLPLISLNSGHEPAVFVPPWVRENILRNRLNLEPVLILALTKIRPRAEVLACQKQAQPSR